MALDVDVSVFRANALLSLFEPEALRLLAFSTEARTVKSGEILFRTGDKADGALLIVQGLVMVTAEGREALHGASALLGETALFTDSVRSATAAAVEPSTLRRIPRYLVGRVLAEYPETTARLRDHFRQRLGEFGRSLAEIERLL